MLASVSDDHLEQDHPHDEHEHDDHDDHGHDRHEHGHDRHEHGHDRHEHGHDRHEHGHEHAHPSGLVGRVLAVVRPHSQDAGDKVDAAMEASAQGIRALWISLAVLVATAALQAIVVAFSGSRSEEHTSELQS